MPAGRDSLDLEGRSLPRTPISIRLGDLERPVAERWREGESVAATIRRDLARYYRVLEDSLKGVHLSAPEVDALAVFAACEPPRFDASSYRYLWAELQTFVDRERERARTDPGNCDLPDDADLDALVRKLRELPPGATLALVDRLERYVRLMRPRTWPIDEAALIESRLTTEHAWANRAGRRGHVPPRAEDDRPLDEGDVVESRPSAGGPVPKKRRGRRT